MLMRIAVVALSLLIVALSGAGCLQSNAPGTPTPTAATSRYAVGDLLTGNLSAAGFDDPNGTPGGAAIVILEYQPAPGQYVYTLVAPVSGGWAYVYPSNDWTARLARDRTVFEAFRLERTGHIQLAEIRAATTFASVTPR
jgi:hypothetical protein